MKKMVIVPARGGSKRLPGKNIKLLNGKPLIYHTLDVVVDIFDIIILSTDDLQILNIGKQHSKKIIPLLRPKELATDTSKVLETVNYLFDNYNKCDQIWLCLPTCPLREKKDIIDAINLLTIDIDGVVSITDYEFPPSLGLKKD